MINVNHLCDKLESIEGQLDDLRKQANRSAEEIHALKNAKKVFPLMCEHKDMAVYIKRVDHKGMLGPHNVYMARCTCGFERYATTVECATFIREEDHRMTVQMEYSAARFYMQYGEWPKGVKVSFTNVDKELGC